MTGCSRVSRHVKSRTVDTWNRIERRESCAGLQYLRFSGSRIGENIGVDRTPLGRTGADPDPGPAVDDRMGAVREVPFDSAHGEALIDDGLSLAQFNRTVNRARYAI